MKTKVLFLKEKESKDIFAYFPGIMEGINKSLCYSHIGQHSVCHKEYAANCKEAFTNEYLPLLAELVQIGYKNLQILNAQRIEVWRNPTPGEIKFGHGAIHYRYVTMADIGITKTGDIKRWFVYPSDNLRYYTH